MTPNTPSDPVQHNPNNLTPEQVGVSEGWRLLDRDEIIMAYDFCPLLPQIEKWDSWEIENARWNFAGWCGAEPTLTYRTRLSRPELRAARGLPPVSEQTEKGGDAKCAAHAEHPLEGLIVQSTEPSRHSNAGQQSNPSAPATPAPAGDEETPRTDALIDAGNLEDIKAKRDDHSHYFHGVMRLASHSRTLERELSASRREVAEITRELRAETIYGKEKDDTATTFMNQVKRLQSELATATEQLQAAVAERDTSKEEADTWIKHSGKMKLERDSAESRAQALETERDLQTSLFKNEAETSNELSQNLGEAESRARTAEAEAASLKEGLVALQDTADRALDFCIGLTGRKPDEIERVFAERDKLLGYYTEIVKELGHDLALKTIRELRAELEEAKKDVAVLDWLLAIQAVSRGYSLSHRPEGGKMNEEQEARIRSVFGRRKFSRIRRWKFEFKLEDFWIGVFWKRGKLGEFDLWICIMPCVPFHYWSWEEIKP